MTLRSSAPLSVSSIYSEFGAPVNAALSELVKGGNYVTSGVTAAIPTAPPMAVSDFYGATAEPRLTFVSATASVGTLGVTPDANGKDVNLTWAHASLTDAASKAISGLITLRYRLGNPPAGNYLYLSCPDGQTDGGIFIVSSGQSAIPSVGFGATANYTRPTHGTSRMSTPSDGVVAEVSAYLTELSSVPGMVNRLNEAVTLSVAPTAGYEFNIHINITHSFANIGAAVAHQGTSNILFNPSILLMSGLTVAQENFPVIYIAASGQLTVGS